MRRLRGRAAARRASLAAILVVACLATLSGCGAERSLSDRQLRSHAARICARAATRTDRIAEPGSPAGAKAFVDAGIAALGPATTALDALRPSADDRDELASARTALHAELTALRAAASGLRAGNDPVVEIATLQQQLEAPEHRSASAWSALEVPGCASLTA